MDDSNLKQALENVGEDLVNKFRREASVKGLKATGKLDKSFSYKLIGDELQIFAKDYAEALEKGSSPAKSSRDWQGKKARLEEWIKAKGIRPVRKLKNGSKFAKLKTDKNSAYKSMLFAISKSISKKGIIKRYGYSGSGFMSEIIKEEKRNIKVILTSAFKKDIVMELNKIK